MTFTGRDEWRDQRSRPQQQNNNKVKDRGNFKETYQSMNENIDVDTEHRKKLSIS